MWYNEDRQKSTGNILYILRLVVEDATAPDVDKAIASLFSMALEEAKKWCMEEVQIWSPGEPAIAAGRLLDPQARVIHREEESITSLRWHGNINDPDSQIPATEQCDWVGNEKFAWC